MKSKIIKKITNISIIISIIILPVLLIFKEGIDDLDELWQYNFANNMCKGLVPYRDFNIVVTPFFPFLASMFLRIFSNQLIVMRIFNTIIFASILIMSYKIFKILKLNNVVNLLFVLILYFLFYYDLGVEYNYLILLITLIFLYIELYNTDKYGIFELKNDFWLGVLIGINILTKHTIGIIISCAFLFYKLIFIKDRDDLQKIVKILIYRFCGMLIPIIILFFYLIINDALYEFINYCILGIGEFNNKVSYLKLFFNKNILIAFFAFLTPMTLLSFIGLFRYRYNNEVKKILILLIFSIAMFVGIFPIANSGHFIIYGFIGILSTLYMLYIILKKNIKNGRYKIFIKNFAKLYIYMCLIIYILLESKALFELYKNNKICKNELDNYYGIIITEATINKINTIDEFIINKKEAGKKVLILDSSACFYNIPINIYNKDYDMFNKGNLGRNGESRIIKEISESKDTIYLILNDKYTKNWQTPLDIINYVKENKDKTGEILQFDIYE